MLNFAVEMVARRCYGGKRASKGNEVKSLNSTRCCKSACRKASKCHRRATDLAGRVGKVRKGRNKSEDLPFFALHAYGTMGTRYRAGIAKSAAPYLFIAPPMAWISPSGFLIYG